MLELSARKLRWHQDLAPGHERREGELHIGGVAVSQLADLYGTPSLIIDGSVLEATISEFVANAKPHRIDVAYAGKALLLYGIAKVIAQTPLRLDVCSLGELATAERAGLPAQRLVFHGCGKTTEELRAAAAGRVGRIVVDNLEELREFGAYASGPKAARVLLRVNTGIEAHTHAYVQTGGDDTKFGIAARDFKAAAGVLFAHPSLRLRGLHSHIGSQIYEAGAFLANMHKLMEAASQFHAWSLPVEELIVGGGFGIESRPGDALHIDVPSVIEAIATGAKERAAALQLPPPLVGIEPGRAIIGRAGTSLYRVMARKRQSQRTFVVVDGGIADNPRPALYDAYHHAILASRTSTASPEHTIVCGRSCENDRLTEAPLPSDIRRGDLLAVCTTGAYTYSMARNYNRFPKPAVVYAQDGNHRLMARRETSEDVVRNDVDA